MSNVSPEEPTRLDQPAVQAWTPPLLQNPKVGTRLREADRSQVFFETTCLNEQLAADHPSRAIWAMIERLNLSALYQQIDARSGVAGAPAIDPKILLGLWVFATSEGEGSAREIWRLTGLHTAYRWLCGGVEVGYHTLSDFRSQQGQVVDNLITQVLALLMHHELIDLSRVAQDGTRVRASAGAASFRREETLQGLKKQAQEHLDAVTQEGKDPALSARRAAAIKRGATERVKRLEAALKEVPEVKETKSKNGSKEETARVSTSDPDARVMKMGDGGFRPAFNIQFATTTDASRVIVGVAVSNRGSDAGQSTPMLEQVERRTGVRPSEILVDGGYAQHEAIDAATAMNVEVYAPVPKPRKDDGRDQHAPHPGDSEAVVKWRSRMATTEAKTIYKQRAATAETVNADAKAHRGLDGLQVRGVTKALGSASLFALTYDMLRAIGLGV